MSLSYCATFSNIILPLSSKCSIQIKNLWISKIFYHFLKLCWHFLSIVISFCVLFVFVDLYLLNFLIVTLVGVCRRRILGSITGGDRNAVEVSVLGLPGGFVSILLLICLSHVIWVPSLPSPSSWLLIISSVHRGRWYNGRFLDQSPAKWAQISALCSITSANLVKSSNSVPPCPPLWNGSIITAISMTDGYYEHQIKR